MQQHVLRDGGYLIVRETQIHRSPEANESIPVQKSV